MTFKLSPSTLNLMQECPRCFWLSQHKVWKRPSGIFPSLPSGMDRILKTHFDKFMENGKLPPELWENGECKNMKLFDDKNKLKLWQSNFKGVSWKDKSGNELHGAVYNFLLRKNGYQTEDYFFLLFYVPKEVMATGEVIFDTTLVKMKVDVKMAEKIWKDALKLLEGGCPKKCCEWCGGK